MSQISRDDIKNWVIDFFSVRSNVFPLFDSSYIKLIPYLKIDFDEIMKKVCRFDNASYLEAFPSVPPRGRAEGCDARIYLYQENEQELAFRYFKTKSELFGFLGDSIFYHFDELSETVKESIDAIVVSTNDKKAAEKAKEIKYMTIEQNAAAALRQHVRESLGKSIMKQDVILLQEMQKTYFIQESLSNICNEEIKTYFNQHLKKIAAQFDTFQLLKRIDSVI